MNLEGGEDSVGAGGLLALGPSSLTAPHLSLGRGEATVVTLQEGAPGEPLLLCPVEEDGAGSAAPLPPDAAITYATLDAGGNFVLQAGEAGLTAGVKGAPREGQLVVVGEAGGGEPITYIYIQGEGEGEEEGDKEGPEGHTITLNAADGSALHTLPAPYTSHTYGDLVLVGPPPTPEHSALEPGPGDRSEEEVGQAEKQVLLLSVGPLKVEDNTTPAADPSTDPGQDKGLGGVERPADAPQKVMRVRRVTQQQQESREGGEEGEIDKEEEEEDEEDGSCSTFEERLATRDSLMPPRRERRTAPSGSLSCPACEARFRSSRQYHSHLQTHRGPDAWHCPVCRHPCQSAAALRTHRLGAHGAARPFSCPSCPLTFRKSLVLEDHIRSVHNKERPLACSLCPKAFYRPYDLKMHLNLHLGIKTKVCDVCGRQFSHSSNLIRHQCLHTGAKPYVCSICGKRFKQVTLLHKHRVTHQEGSCPLCPASVSTAAALRRHYRLDHKRSLTLREAGRVLRGQRGAAPRSFYCRVCGAQFSVKAELVAHEEWQHPRDSQHHCASCRRVVPMAEVKTHACLTPEEHRNSSIMLHLRTKDAASTTNTTTTAAVTTTITTTASTTTQDAPTTSITLPGPQPPQRECKGETEEEEEEDEEEEEEYLVMYITPEGESVSYVMKKGCRAGLDQVLQINAPEHLAGEEPAPPLPRPEDTIMINVPPQDPDHTLLLGQGETPHTPSPPTPPSHPALPLQSIKLEPHREDEEPLEILPLPAPPMLSQGTLTEPKTEEATSKSNDGVVIKAEKEDEEEEEDEKGVSKKSALEARLSCNNNTTTRGGKGLLECCDCGKKFTKQWNFQQHLATHDASLHRYRCEQCGLTFAYRSTLNKHRDHHNPTPQIHQCQKCPKTYKCLASLRQHHKRDHERWRPYACELCNKEFFSKSDYKYHMRLHKREHPYMCFTCGQKFSHVSHLHRHERVHTGERPHKCPICPKTFIQHGTLRIHLKKHEKQDNTTTQHQEEDHEHEHQLQPTNTTTTMSTHDTFTDTPNLALKLAMGEDTAGTLNEATLLSKDSGDDLLGIHGERITLSQDAGDVGPTLGQDTLPDTMILSEGGQGATTFPGGHAAVVAGVDGECIAIFVQEDLN
ncbi:zinc finger protein 184-like [Eriocheir sinensis]|uniref:zinc finger protein 184-like n=1 Tax=Eriocheir sinensis TaxID=95602 RepID=UPI0021C5BBB3|nr:zinc finger protein 184-like [Eriocheir sinensis]XP_050697246.1 zinc finger protein 184-like [Eriocheir sinensis]XP_050697247.1 zinc finger protein 184-like [Eriocheir sinensis]XP_050697248.1 zinc finger protein 184-like [Eriocheir sinensis]XP_050697250.1 zinc finger protein 184-like [Eriocheir sinensis]